MGSQDKGVQDSAAPLGQSYYQNLLKSDKVPPPKTLLNPSTDDTLGTEDIPAERYFSQEFHNLEMEKVWKKVWQIACWGEDIPNPGDVYVYDLADISVLIIRQEDGSLKAFHNSCLHRGRQLMDKHGHAKVLRCPYHSFTWNLDGSFKHLPSAWDFPQIDEKNFGLPEVRLEMWNGFAFINLDPKAPSLQEYLEDMPAQWAEWDMTRRFKSAHVIKHMPANWKVVLDAFIEAFHADSTHPQMVPFSGIEQSQYDVWPGRRHFSRAITPMGMISTAAKRHLEEQEIVDGFIRGYLPNAVIGSPETIVPPGGTAREVIGRLYAESVGRMFNVDVSHLSIADALDGVWYYVFPNFEPWPTLGYPLFYRFRPYGNNPNESLMDIMILSPFEGERPPSAPTVYQEFDDGSRLSDVLGPLGAVLDQDVDNMQAIQRGLKASVRKGLVMSKYQESRIRHYHRTLMEYLSK